MKNSWEPVNMTEALVVLFTGAALVLSVWLGQENIASALGGGLVGYLGAVYVKGNGE